MGVRNGRGDPTEIVLIAALIVAMLAQAALGLWRLLAG
jgi:hypothetical protein